MIFTKLKMSEHCPDETTLCRFRNKIIEIGLYERLFKEINRQLEKLRLKIKNFHRVILDATIIESQARPKKQIEIQEDRKEEQTNHEIVEQKIQTVNG